MIEQTSCGFQQAAKEVVADNRMRLESRGEKVSPNNSHSTPLTVGRELISLLTSEQKAETASAPLGTVSHEPRPVARVMIEPLPKDLPAVDFDQLLRRCMGKTALAERLLASFEQRFWCEVSEIAESCLVGDLTRLVRVAHLMRGASANVSAPRLHKIFEHIEESARTEQMDVVVGWLEQLDGEWNEFTRHQASHRLPAPAAATEQSCVPHK